MVDCEEWTGQARPWWPARAQRQLLCAGNADPKQNHYENDFWATLVGLYDYAMVPGLGGLLGAQAGRQALPRAYSYVHARVTYTGANGAAHWASRVQTYRYT